MIWLAVLCAVVSFLSSTSSPNRWHSDVDSSPVVTPVAGVNDTSGYKGLDQQVRSLERFKRLSPETRCRAYFERLAPLPTSFESIDNVTEVITATRIYNRCYLDGYSSEKPSRGLEKTVYPWITGKVPHVENWQREVVREFPPVPTDETFWPHWLNQTEGRGIVITLGDRHMHDLAGLIRVLRVLNNTLPIEVVNYEPISNYTTQLIAYLATTSDVQGTQQRVSFVNATASINPKLEHQLNGWGRKTLAVLFSTFSEVMLLDCDTVFVQQPHKLFDHPGYGETGTLFFLDRSTNVVRDKHVMPNLQRSAPSVWDQVAFDIPPWTNRTYNTSYYKYGHNERLEAGVVLVDKKRKFSSMLMTAQGFRTNPLTQWSHGEKEYFWLGPTLNGDESYSWAGDRAGMIGPRISGDERTHPHEDIVEVCGMQVAHFINKELFWFNGGFHAKGANMKGDWTEEMWTDRERYKDLNLEEFIEAGKRPFKITHGLIPPHDIERGGEKVMFAYNEDNYPNAGLRISYKPWLWCGYSVSGSGDNSMYGTVIEMTEDQTRWYDFIGRVWDDKYVPKN
ncbi:hypothetical protein DIURU_005150 [Diutina rugosa]|uniref:Glycosyltransferase family 71 protein n=1 Tax=Diutina rugosa TaxID=5481 RepID=A0A642UGW6_DIURU|nr:uncharacterized protein DIURU_005150 [Diutina rugosa]KAA8897551.1 hypothetical protein DIURU_005150 [Diutina rugosa]